VSTISSAGFHNCHVLDLDDFSREEIEEVLETTESMKEILAREIKQVPTLRGKTVVNMFFEESTRTRISFELAAKALSANVINFTAKGSSVEKGESLLDTVRTLQALGAEISKVQSSMRAMVAMLIRRKRCLTFSRSARSWGALPSSKW
jgi:aspartate carbamoyltransferase catalytic subunit